MHDPAEIVRRKDEHLDIALKQGARNGSAGFDQVRFAHCAAPELHLDHIDLGRRFLGWSLALPFLISSMTGGPARGAAINTHLAEAAEQLRIPLAVGSQRVGLEGGPAAGIGRELRKTAPNIPILANLGGAQLVLGYGVDEARRAMDDIGADGLIIHLNPLQEAIQPGGDRDWRGVLAAIEVLCRTLERPLIVKEVGYGISADLCVRLANLGVAAIDVAGSGGTSWALIEAERHSDGGRRAIGQAFGQWGIPSALALVEARRACPDTPLIGSGGVRDGVDAAKAIRLGADLVGQAGGVLKAAMTSTQAVLDHFGVLAEQLRIVCFCTGSRDLAALRSAQLLPDALPVHDL